MTFNGRIAPGPNGNLDISPDLPLTRGATYASATGRAQLIFLQNGNLVVNNENNKTRWESKTEGADLECLFQKKEGLVIKDSSGRILFKTDIKGKDAATLAVQDNGNVIIYDTSNTARWMTNTEH